jgi:hypothetical protein
MVTVTDNTAPTAICQNITVTLVNGVATITAAEINNGSTDNCGIASVSVSPSTFTVSNVGPNTVTLTVVDASGNTSTCTATVTVVNPSGISCTATTSDTVIYFGYGHQTATLSVTSTGTAPFTYNWSGQNLSCQHCPSPIFNPSHQGNYSFDVTVTDATGATTSCNVTVCVMDVRASGDDDDDNEKDHGPGQKVYLCHYPPGNPNNPQTIIISVNAVPFHLNNHPGDHLGKCGQVCGDENHHIGDKDEKNAPTLITDERAAFEILIYPNPFKDQFHIKIQSENSTPVQLRIFDITGKAMLESQHVQLDGDVVLGNGLASGVYFVEIKQGENTKVIRMFKE